MTIEAVGDNIAATEHEIREFREEKYLSHHEWLVRVALLSGEGAEHKLQPSFIGRHI